MLGPRLPRLYVVAADHPTGEAFSELDVGLELVALQPEIGLKLQDRRVVLAGQSSGIWERVLEYVLKRDRGSERVGQRQRNSEAETEKQRER